MNYFIKGIKNYVNFSGRARRAEYWYYTLFVLLTMLVAVILDTVLFDRPSVFYLVAGLFFFLPGLAVAVRRLHDTNRSGKILLWYVIAYIIWVVLFMMMGATALVSIIANGDLSGVSGSFLAVFGGGLLIFLVWGIMMLVWMCTEGTKGDNKYGPDPKAVIVE